MFRYGGPIKEGIMSGIREPKKTGGNVGAFNVGSPVKGMFPKDATGREHHVGPGLLALPYIGAGLRLAARPFGSWAMKNIPKMFSGPQRNWAIGKGFSSTPGYTKNVAQNVFTPNKFGKYLLGSPEGRLVTGGAGWAGKAGKGIYAAGKGIAKSPLTVGTLAWTGYQWVKPDGTPANENEIAKAKATQNGPPGGGDPGMQGTGEWFAAQAEKEAKIAKQKEWNNRIKKYRDIMDIKGMNKQAAYKSLIDASKLIQESGDFKGDIKSGKLINQVIQAASKQFDKPKKTSDAINTLILQNELKKDLSAETDALDKKYKQSAIALNEKKLAGESLSETINASYQRTGQFPSGATLAGVARTKGIDAQVLPTKDIPKDTEALDYIVSIVTESHTNPKKSPFPPGDYVIKDRLITVDETGKVTPLI